MLSQVDLGNRNTLQFSPIAQGQTTTVFMRANAGSGRLLEFQVVVTVVALTAVPGSCEQGSGWYGNWDCNSDMYPQEFQIVGSDTALKSGGAAITVASFQLLATAPSALTLVSATIVKLTMRQGSTDSSTVNSEAVAALGFAQIGGATSRRHLLSLEQAHAAAEGSNATLAQRQRRLLQSTPRLVAGLYGNVIDTAADSVPTFDISDVTETSQVIACPGCVAAKC